MKSLWLEGENLTSESIGTFVSVINETKRNTVMQLCGTLPICDYLMPVQNRNDMNNLVGEVIKQSVLL